MSTHLDSGKEKRPFNRMKPPAEFFLSTVAKCLLVGGQGTILVMYGLYNSKCLWTTVV